MAYREEEAMFIFSSQGQKVARLEGASVYDLKGEVIYRLKGRKLYKLSGELVGHLPDTHDQNIRLDAATDKLFSFG